ncbi:hypothetical protein Q4555_13995 [Octadecabacter sp. 1_MG-2023]|uniref:hypothetical protein n=1 Tax=unclassified Octadecabacter TaxID=196158 RepID=UPI001C084823|nr:MULTISPECIES: hypothetical protein [unclassified Octadecabacter]MBU2991812.1 hypothetical protein [Octadecabacter sp. B2R22]MDO6735785.1 hypothetical protein [Octadecabacter sp. 1_MG-2023]
MFKSVSLALAAIAASATIASADGNYLTNFAPSTDRDTEIQLGLVVAEAPGVVEIYSYTNGQTGALLGTEAVHAGGNADVEVEVTPAYGDAIALLKVGGQVVDSEVLNFDMFN